MGFKKVCVYGFGQNEYFFMLPAIRYVLGEIKPERIISVDEIREKKPECDVLCVNCGMAFYELELFFKVLSDSYDSASKPSLFCLSWEGLPLENLEIMEENQADLIMFDLRSVDFGFNSLNTAASHWHGVLAKFRVRSVFELRAKFR